MEKLHRPIIKFGVSTEKRTPDRSGLAKAPPPHEWKEMTLADLPTNLVLQNQKDASDCGANGPKKMINLQTKGELVVSAHPYYARRSNSPEEGMSLDDIINIPCDEGTCLESEDPSDGLSEEQLDLPVTVPTPLLGTCPEELEVTDIETLASYADAYGGLIVTVNIAWDEWNTDQGVPAYVPGAEIAGGHCLGGGIPAIYNGSKGIFFQNSWGNDTDSINQTSWVFFTEDFLKNRGTGAGTFYAPELKPQTTLFPSTLHEGMVGKDVEQLQSLLGITADGIFGLHTLEAVIAFQAKHGLVPDGIVGPKTAAALSASVEPTPMPIEQNATILKWCAAAQTYEGWCENPPSRSFGNNNPGNLEFDGQPNAVLESGHTPDRFAHFATYQDGLNALYDLFYRACSGQSHIYHPTMTLNEFYAVYAPSSDGNDVNAYAVYIANALGVSTDTVISTLI